MVINSLAEALPYRSFGDGNLIDLRGGLMAALRIAGPPPESATDVDLAQSSRQLAAGIRHLGTQDTIHVVYNRLPAAAPEKPTNATIPLAAKLVDLEQHRRFEQEEYWVNSSTLWLTYWHERPVGGWLRQAAFATQAPQRRERHELEARHALDRFAAFIDAATAGSNVKLTPMSPAEIWDELLAIVPYYEHRISSPKVRRLNEILGGEYLLDKMQPRLHGFHLIPICVTAYPIGDEDEPGYTMPQMLAPLLSQPGRMTVSARFNCRWQIDVEKALDQAQNSHTWGALVQPLKWLRAFANQDHEIDDATDEIVRDLKAAQGKAAAGWSFGDATVTAIVRDTDLNRGEARAHEILRECHSLQLQARIEDVNAWEAIAGSWPGMREPNARRPIISGGNFADLVLPATSWMGIWA